jgi:DNA-binding GntR family transcriptional regulator
MLCAMKGAAKKIEVAWGAPGAAMGTPLVHSLPEQVAARLSERIVAGGYAPGQRIMEQALAEQFGVSRGPVREALRILERDGLVTILPWRGALVTNPSIAEVREIFDIRAMLNGLRDRLIAEDPHRDRVLPQIEADVMRLARLARDAKRGEEYVETVWSLNRTLTHACPSQRLRAILDSLARQTLRYSRLGLGTAERRRQSAAHWQKLLAAIRSGDGESAERIARERVLDSRDAAIRALGEAKPSAPDTKKRRVARAAV